MRYIKTHEFMDTELRLFISKKLMSLGSMMICAVVFGLVIRSQNVGALLFAGVVAVFGWGLGLYFLFKK
jgi:hypothetical protein